MSEDNQPKTTAALAREMMGLPPIEPPSQDAIEQPLVEHLDPELTDFMQSVDSNVREIEAGDATADAIEKARGTK